MKKQMKCKSVNLNKENKIMAAKKRTLKGIVKAIEGIERSIKMYASRNDSDMVEHYKKQLRDMKYLKTLVVRDIKKKKYRRQLGEQL
jgi:hypothetical protein